MTNEEKLFTVIVICPRPPSVGGITVWSEKLSSLNKKNKEIKIEFINTYSTFRNQKISTSLNRLLSGTLQTFIVFIKLVLKIFKKKSKLVHLCTSGKFGLIRDLFILFICKYFNIKTIYHIHFGRIPFVFKNNSFEKFILIICIYFSNKTIVIDRKSQKNFRKNLFQD